MNILIIAIVALFFFVIIKAMSTAQKNDLLRARLKKEAKKKMFR